MYFLFFISKKLYGAFLFAEGIDDIRRNGVGFLPPVQPIFNNIFKYFTQGRKKVIGRKSVF